MSYKSLYKLFMMNDTSKFNEIYQERFNSNSSIKFDLYINNYQAFFNYDSNIMVLVSKINNINYEVNKLFKSLPVSATSQLLTSSLIEEIHFTNDIEGVISTKKDINDIINEIESKSKTHNRLYGIAYKYLMLAKEDFKFETSADIRHLYDEMLYNEIKEEDENNLPDGKIFRKNAVHVYKTGERIVHNGLLPEEKIIDYMDKALLFLNNANVDILIRVAIFHYFFGYIHPFYDGNGRINRFISSYLLSKYFNNILGYRLSMTIKENLNEYLEAFEHTNDIRNRADISTFVYNFLDIVFKAYEKTELYAYEKLYELNKYQQLIDKKIIIFNDYKNKDDIYKLLNILTEASIFNDFGITKNKLCELLGKGNTKITEYLTLLKEHNLCISIKSGRYYYYLANLKELE